MPWIYLLLALGALLVAFKTASMALMAFALVAGLGLMLAWMMSLLAQRVDSRTGNVAMIVDPVELRRLREQAEARRAADVGASSSVAETSDQASRPPA